MDSDYKPSESDVKTVMEVHGLFPEGPLLDGALGFTALYVDSPHRLVGEYTKKEEERNEKDSYRGIIVCRGTYGDEWRFDFTGRRDPDIRQGY